MIYWLPIFVSKSLEFSESKVAPCSSPPSQTRPWHIVLGDGLLVGYGNGLLLQGMRIGDPVHLDFRRGGWCHMGSVAGKSPGLHGGCWNDIREGYIASSDGEDRKYIGMHRLNEMVDAK